MGWIKNVKGNFIDRAIADLERAKARVLALEKLLPELRNKQTQAQLIAAALKNYDESTKAIQEAKHVPTDILSFATKHIESAYRRRIADATR